MTWRAGNAGRLGKGVYTDNVGKVGKVQVSRLTRERRFDFGTPDHEIDAWLERTQAFPRSRWNSSAWLVPNQGDHGDHSTA